MNKPSDLLLLIQALTSAEKRYFKVFASQHIKGKKNNYIALFDVLDNLKIDERDIATVFKGEPFAKQLRFTRHYLYKLILKSLRSFHSEDSHHYELYLLIVNVHVLYRKKLYEQAYKQLKKAKKMAYGIDKNACALDIINLEVVLADRLNSNPKVYDKIYKESVEALSVIKYAVQFRKIDSDVAFFVSKNGQIRTEAQKKEFEILIHQIQMEQPQGESILEKYYYYSMRATYHYYLQEYKEAYNNIKVVVNALEDDKQNISARTGGYVTSISKLLDTSKHFDQAVFLDELNRLKSFDKDLASLPMRITILTLVYAYELEYYALSGLTDKAKSIVDDAAQHIKKNFIASSYNEVFGSRIILNMILFHLVDENHEQALDYINDYINHHKFSSSNLLKAYVLRVITLFELGKWSIIENFADAALRSLRESKKSYHAETEILKFLKKQTKNTANDIVQIKEWKELSSNLYEGEDRNNTNKYFPFDFWIESKMKKTDLKKILRSYSEN